MKKNKLYTVNKWNMLAFMPEERNLFWPGGSLDQGTFFQHQGGGTYGNMETPQTSVAPIVQPARAAQRRAGSSTIGAQPDSMSVKANPDTPAASVPEMKMPEGNGGKQTFTLKPSTLQTIGMVAQGLGSINTGERRGMWDTLDPVHHLAGGRESGAGNAMGDAGVAVTQAGMQSGNPYLMAAGAGLKVIGGLTNAAFGIKTDQEKLNSVRGSIDSYKNFRSDAASFDDIGSLQGFENADGIYKGGWFSGGRARRKNEELKQQLASARGFAERSLDNNIFNIKDDQMNEAMRNFAAFGGPLNSFGTGALGIMQNDKYLDAINNRSNAIAGKQQVQTLQMPKMFAGGGGLESAFLDSFASDPIGAAVRYNQGLDALAAEQEAAEAQAAKEAEYEDMRRRIASLETQNQGLQALMSVQPSGYGLDAVLPEPSPSVSSPSKATLTETGQSDNWAYIEQQLRNSGKFNDIQIEGIKYNLQRESGIGRYDGGDNGTARGIAQWRGDRIPKDMSLEGQTRHLIETLGNYDGNQHWIGRANYEGFLNARTPEEAHYYIAKGYERPDARITDRLRRESDMSLKRINAFGGELGTNGTDFSNGLIQINEGGTHSENPLDGVPMGLDPEGIPNLVEEGETVYNDYVFSNRIQVPKEMYRDLGLGTVGKKRISFADASKKLAKESEQRPNDPISIKGLQASLGRLAEVQEAERMRQQMKDYVGLQEYACGGRMKNLFAGGSQKRTNKSSNHPYGSLLDKIAFDSDRAAEEVQRQRQVGEQPAITEAARQEIAMDGYKPETTQEAVDGITRQYSGLEPQNYDFDPYPTWMRYAPAYGAGLFALTDTLGLTNKPDYTYADKLEAAANQAGYAPNIGYNPIGNYLRFQPMDIWYEQNRLNANARATDRALVNNSAPVGTKMAGLLANGYNNQIANGNLYRQALEYNDAKRERVADFNRKTNMFNSQMGLEADMANARYRQAASQMGLSGLAQAAALRDSIDQRVGAARSANIKNLLDSLGNIGRENFALNQINSDRSRRYGVDKKGVSKYKR